MKSLYVVGFAISLWASLYARFYMVNGLKPVDYASIRQQCPLPKLTGTVGMTGTEQVVPLAWGLDYRPSPNVQQFEAYTPELAALEVEWFEGTTRPDWLLFHIRAQQGRYPMQDFGPCWTNFFNYYEPMGQLTNGMGFLNDILLMRKRATVGKAKTEPLFQKTIHFNQIETVPSGLIFAKVVVKKSFRGKIKSVLFKPPTLNLTVFTDNQNATYRLVNGEAGFLLSPFVGVASQLLDLAHAPPIKAMAISTADTNCYQPEITVQFFSTEIDGLVSAEKADRNHPAPAFGRALTKEQIDAAESQIKNKSQIEQLSSAAQNGDLNAQYNLGLTYYNQGDITNAILWLKRAAEKGLVGAQNDLGVMLFQAHDFAGGVSYLNNAAGLGSAKAQFSLGLIYLNGNGVKQNYEMAAQMFLKAAQQGDVEAEKIVGEMYRDGIGQKADKLEAYKWLKLAALQGNKQAESDLKVLSNSMTKE